MLELLFCSLFTILPDYLIKRYRYDMRWGSEITFFNMWYELRWGITACAILTLSLLTLIFYYHPTTSHVTSIFRTVSILPEQGGRVGEVYVDNHAMVDEGDPLFSVQDSSQLAAVHAARGALEEVRAEFEVALSSLDEAKGGITAAQSALEQAKDDLRRKTEFRVLDSDAISQREVDSSRNQVASLQGSLDSAVANGEAVAAYLNTVLPAAENTAEEVLKQAAVELDKTIVYAGVDGRVTQFFLQPGDIVNPMFRPAGVLVPTAWKGKAVQAGFSQLAARVVKAGTLAEISCFSMPFTIIPMVVTTVQPVIAAGQGRPSDQLVDLLDRARPGTLLASMEPLYPNGMEGIVPGTKCIANAYSNNHELIASGELGTMGFLYYHMVDAVGVVHAILLRLQALIIPVKLLVFSDH
jgi:multidrug resistance efflux pump